MTASHMRPFFMFLATCLIFPLAANSETFSAQVVSVINGGIIKVSQDGKDRILVLYGVDLTGDESVKAKELVASSIKGKVLSFEVKVEKPGLTYVDVLLPDGTSLNESLLSRGLAEVENLSAASDAFYRELEENAKARKVGIWGDSNEVGPIAVGPNEESKSGFRKTEEEFLAEKEMKRLAQFESEFAKWARMSKDDRQRMRMSIERANNRQSALTKSGFQSRSGAVQGLKDQQSNLADKIVVEQIEEALEVSEVYDDFNLDWNRSMLDSFVEDYSVERILGYDYSADISSELIDEYALRVTRDLNRLDGEANAISEKHQRNIRSNQRHLATVNDTLLEEGSRLKLNAAMVARQNQRSASVIGRLDALDAAIARKYAPVLRTKTIDSWKGEKNQTTTPFEVSSPIMRLDWYVARGSRTSRITISLFDASNNEVKATARLNKPPHQAFLLIDEPGEYYIKIKVEGQVRYLVEAIEINKN